MTDERVEQARIFSSGTTEDRLESMLEEVIAAYDELAASVDRRAQEAREEERDRIAHLFDYLYPHWARTIRAMGERNPRAERAGADLPELQHQTEGWK